VLALRPWSAEDVYDTGVGEQRIVVLQDGTRLRAVNSSCDIEPIVDDVRAANVEQLIAGSDIVIDGCDNFPTRHLINEAAVRARIPWVYGACVGSYGISLTILPGITPCLRCVQDELPGAGESPTCDTAGIIPPAVHLVAGWQVAEVLKIAVGDHQAVRRTLWASDLWTGTFQRLDMTAWRNPACVVCGSAPSYPLLSAGDAAAVVLCGRDAVQIRRPSAHLGQLRERVGAALLIANDYIVRWRDGEQTATCFRDGRVIVQGVENAVQARAFCDRWLG
jgi:hypothetical protein